MSDTNVNVIEGRLVKAAELKFANNGRAICTFTIANNKSWKNTNDEWVEKVSFFDCVIYGKYGESMSKHLSKGRAVTVVSRLTQDRWDKDGHQMSRVYLEVTDLKLGLKPNGSSSKQDEHDTSMDFPPPEEGNPFEENTSNVVF
ncbi:MAG: single-stranded DNA-binding protein [Bacilli bacterium]|nr:single-stranded DNA-binding protein [Bacilli bacterium]